MVHDLQSHLGASSSQVSCTAFALRQLNAVSLRLQLSGGYITVMTGGCMKWCWLF